MNATQPQVSDISAELKIDVDLPLTAACRLGVERGLNVLMTSCGIIPVLLTKPTESEAA